MTAHVPDEALVRTYRLPHGYTVEFCVGPQSFEATWSPSTPTIRKPRQRAKFIEAYRVVRRAFCEEMTRHVGGNVLLVDPSEYTCEAFMAPAKN